MTAEQIYWMVYCAAMPACGVSGNPMEDAKVLHEYTLGHLKFHRIEPPDIVGQISKEQFVRAVIDADLREVDPPTSTPPCQEPLRRG